MKRKLSIVVYYGMSRIGTSLKTYHDIRFLRHHVGNFTLTFVSPVRTYDCFDHFSLHLFADCPAAALCK